MSLHTLIVEKTKILTSIVLAIVLAFLLFGLSSVLFPSPEPTPMPGPEVSILDQIFSAVSWVGLAVICAVAIVGAILFASPLRDKGTENEEVNAVSSVAGVLKHSTSCTVRCFRTMLQCENYLIVNIKKSKKNQFSILKINRVSGVAC